jgi:hypothetical protein
MVFENGAEGIFRPKGQEVTGQRKFHEEELHVMYSSPNVLNTSYLPLTNINVYLFLALSHSVLIYTKNFAFSDSPPLRSSLCLHYKSSVHSLGKEMHIT